MTVQRRLHHPFGVLETMPMSELLDMMSHHEVATVASVFSNQDGEPVSAVVVLTGGNIQAYLEALDGVADAGCLRAAEAD